MKRGDSATRTSGCDGCIEFLGRMWFLVPGSWFLERGNEESQNGQEPGTKNSSFPFALGHPANIVVNFDASPSPFAAPSPVD